MQRNGRGAAVRILSATVSVAIAGLAIFAMSYLLEGIFPSVRETATLEQKIQLLSKNLDEAARAVSEIEAEIEERQALVQRLEGQRRIAEELITLNEEQVDAVAQLFRAELRREAQSQRWLDIGTRIGIGALFFFLGIYWQRITEFVSRILPGRFREAPSFADNFGAGLTRWETKTGSPRIDEAFGHPAPSLHLPLAGDERTRSFAIVKEISEFKDGHIECTVHLEPYSLVNIVFRANMETNQFYMARLDTRPGCPDAILRNDGPGFGWGIIAEQGQRTSPNEWHQMKVIVREDSIQLYRNDILVASARDATYTSGQVGIFNEVQGCHVDNFIVSSLT